MYKFIVTIFSVLFSSSALADIAKCSIEIQDFRNGSTYTLTKKYIFKKGSEDVQREHFHLPGTSDYNCTLAFVRINNGTMLSCTYKDAGHTFFQSDRTVLSDKNSENNLSFRHKTAAVAIKTRCE